MNIRPIIFWSHLTAGVFAGLVILFLSITGIVVMYEHQIVDAFSKRDSIDIKNNNARLTIDEIADIVRPSLSSARVIMLNIDNRETAPIIVHPIGPGDLSEITLNPYTGEEVKSSASGVQSFFETIVGWHRFLGMTGENRGLGRAITGAANFIFMFLLVSGVYLWLPKMWKWTVVRTKIFVRSGLPARARDYNWHHVFSFWAIIPLLIIVFSAIVISYSWANSAFYRAFGEEAPKLQGPAFLADMQKDALIDTSGLKAESLSTLQDAFNAARASNENWTKIFIFIHPEPEIPIVRLMVSDGAGVLPKDSTTVVFDRLKQSIVEIQKFEDWSAAEQARMWIRFVHTGEQYGVVGQTIAGLAALAACFLVYTGLALSYRRLIQPILVGKRKQTA